MSRRSEEYMEQARERLADAQKILGLAHPAVVVSAAYYAALNAANAPLSERGEHARPRKGGSAVTTTPPRPALRKPAAFVAAAAAFVAAVDELLASS